MSRASQFALLLLAAQTVLIGWIGVSTSPVLDELPHLASGISHWEFGTFELYRVNPPLVRMLAALPVLMAGCETDWMGGWSDDPYGRPEFPLGRRFAAVNGERVFWLFTLARWGCLPFVWLGGWCCFRWARALYGDASGLIALGLWCVCPNLLAWGGTICPDLPAASTGLWAAYAFWRWLRTPDWQALLLASLALGVALLTKSTWIVLLMLWPALWAVWRGLGQPQTSRVDDATPGDSRPIQIQTPGVRALAGILCGALYLVNVGYGFSGALQPLGEFTFVSQSLTGHTELGEPGNRFGGIWLQHVPSPLPADYVLGIDVQRYDFEKGKWSYLRGEQRFGGWWWYYLYAFGVKTPLGTLALLLTACATGWQRRGTARLRDEFVLLAPAIVVLLLVSSQTGFNRYLRYALPVLPGLFVWMSRVAGHRQTLALSTTTTLPRHNWGCEFAWACVLASAMSSLRVWPHSLTYFHELAGGPNQGHRHLLDANVDWGQGLLAVRDWLRDQPAGEPLFLADFGWVDAGQAVLTARPVPRLRFDAAGRLTEGDLADVVPGWYVLSVNHLYGYRHYESDRPVYTWLQEFEPVAQPGYANWVFHLTPADVQAFAQRHQRP